MIWLFCIVQITWILTLLRNVPVVTKCKEGLCHEASSFPTDGVDFQYTLYIYCCYNSVVVEQLYPKSWGYLVFIALIYKKRKKNCKTWIFILLFLFYYTLNLHILRNAHSGLSFHGIVIFQTHKKHFIKIFNLMS